MTEAMVEANKQLTIYDELLAKTKSAEAISADPKKRIALFESIFTPELISELSKASPDVFSEYLGVDQMFGEGANYAYYLTQLKSYLENQIKTNVQPTVNDGMTDAITDSIPGVSGAMDAMQGQLVGQAAAMGAAVAAAFNNNLNFRLPNVGAGGGGFNVNVNSPTAQTIYSIRKGLTDASRRAARGYGAG